MILVRIVTAESLETIDLNNLGNHFTVEGNEPAIATNIQHLSQYAKNGDVFYIYVECENINAAATALSNQYHPLEKEVVTVENSHIKILEVLDENFNVVAENIEGNTGARIHEWVQTVKHSK